MESTPHTGRAASSDIPGATAATNFANKPGRLLTLLAGGTAGLCVDLTVYPLDTIKTRLQGLSRSVRPSGQLRLFAGLPVVLCGSAPSAALFFSTYETVKASSIDHGYPVWLSLVLSAGISEMVACIIRVPCETIKQRAQSRPLVGVQAVLSEALRIDGWAVLYRGYLSTILRGLPFSLIQYPVWETLKRFLMEHNRRGSSLPESSVELSKGQFALCGALAGATAGACTTPFDVAKTRIILAQKGSPLATGNVITAFRHIYLERGVRGLFAGVAPRVGQVGIGGAIFLGLYDITKSMWMSALS
uniref:S-adenosylmethionine mitochondrial carrier protein n=1 Tax=Schistocephalus solidus TaxID=70667 RepID=A0A0V0JAG2_SCHSO